MKTIDTILRLAAALVAIGAAIYAIAKYGDQLVAWAKKFCPNASKCNIVYSTANETPEEPAAEAAEEAPAEEAAEEEAPAEEAPVEEAPAEEEAPAPEIPEGEPVAEAEDFAE